MEQLKYMAFLILAVLATVASYYVIILVVLVTIVYFATRYYIKLKEVWNGPKQQPNDSD